MQRITLIVCGTLLTCATVGQLLTAPVQEKAVAPAKFSQATFGGGVHRNMVNLVDKNLPTDWSVEEGKFKNVKWVADIGKETYTHPVIFDGRVFVGTNTADPTSAKTPGQKAHLMCFAEKDGTLLWQNIHDMPEERVIRGYGRIGLVATPTVEGNLVYYCTPAAVVICAQAKDGKILWRYDMMKELEVVPCIACACSPLVVGELMFIMTGNGTVAFESKVVNPKAPSFIALQKKTGKLVWRSKLPGSRIIQGQWSSPVYAELNGTGQVIFGGGDGYLYSMEPETGDVNWKFNCSPMQTEDDRGIKQYIVATPVVYENRVYVAVGDYPGRSDPPKIGHFFCVDIGKTGDVSCENENFDPKDPANKNSALVWHFGGLVKPPPEKKTARAVYLGYSCSTVAAHAGLVYLAECNGFLHCLDAKTGEHYWQHDFREGILGSPYWVDGKIYICTNRGNCCIFEHGKKYQQPRMLDMQESMETPATPVAANGVLYIATPSKLYAIGAK